MVETKVVFYGNERMMNRGINAMQNKGWEVVSTEAVDRGYSGCKTCCLGLLFLPLALLGKKPKMWKVQYKRTK